MYKFLERVSAIILLKPSFVFSSIALRNEGTKKFALCIVYSSLCRGCKKHMGEERRGWGGVKEIMKMISKYMLYAGSKLRTVHN
jgi:hypothetical protein